MSDTQTRLARRHDPIELLAGGLVLILLAAVIVAAVIGSDRRSHSGYLLSETVNPKDFQAVVTLSVRPDIKLPTDSSLVVTSDSLLGGKYLALSPGGASTMLAPGGQITQTQGSISLEQLLSKFIFTVTDTMTKQQSAAKPGGGPGKPDDLPTP